jgi:hypothetical protein
MVGAARIFEAGQPTQALVEMERGLMFVMAISDGSSLAVLASPDCDTDLVAYEMSLLVEAVGDVLTPAARAQGLRAGPQKGPRVDRAFEVSGRADAGVTHGASEVAVSGS